MRREALDIYVAVAMAVLLAIAAWSASFFETTQVEVIQRKIGATCPQWMLMVPKFRAEQTALEGRVYIYTFASQFLSLLIATISFRFFSRELRNSPPRRLGPIARVVCALLVLPAAASYMWLFEGKDYSKVHEQTSIFAMLIKDVLLAVFVPLLLALSLPVSKDKGR